MRVFFSRSIVNGSAAIAVALALSGCGLLPESHDLAGPMDPTAVGSRSLSAGTRDAAWPSDGWWRSYGDDQLTRLIEEGLVGAADMHAAEARLAAADASARSAFGALLPTVGAEGKVDIERQSYKYLIAEQAVPKGWNDAGMLAVGFNWEIDFWGKNRAAFAAATSAAEAATAEAASARLAVSTGIALAYADLAARHADRDAAADAVRVRQQTLALIQERLGNGLENDGAREHARSAAAIANAELAEVDEAIGLARNRIAALVGAGPDRGIVLTRPRGTVVRLQGLPSRLPADLLGRRPDLIAARKRLEAAGHHIDEAKAAFYPNVNLAAMIGRQALGIDVLSNSGATIGSVGPAVSLPLFQGGRLVAAQAGAEADYAGAVAVYDGTLTEALRQVADAVVSRRALTTRLAETRKAATAAEEARRVVSERYRGGLATYLEVLSAEDALIGARRAAAGLQARGFSLDIQLVRALGGGFRTTEKAS